MNYEVSNGGTESGIILNNNTITVPDGAPNWTDDVLTVTDNTSNAILHDGDVLLPCTMPEAEYMYGCTPTAVGMILGYYDLYGYRGTSLSAMIEGDVDLESRGTDGNSHDMDAFDRTAGSEMVYHFPRSQRPGGLPVRRFLCAGHHSLFRIQT